MYLLPYICKIRTYSEPPWYGQKKTLLSFQIMNISETLSQLPWTFIIFFFTNDISINTGMQLTGRKLAITKQNILYSELFSVIPTRHDWSGYQTQAHLVPGSIPKTNSKTLHLNLTHNVRKVCHDVFKCPSTGCSFYRFREYTSFIF